MIDTLYLTEGEQQQFACLSESLREGWKMESETGTVYETPEELYVRATMARFDLHPELEAFVEAVRAGNFDAEIPDDLSEDALQELCFTIGAQGMTSLMTVLFSRIQSDEDLQALASMSMVRHDILKTNADVRIPFS